MGKKEEGRVSSFVRTTGLRLPTWGGGTFRHPRASGDRLEPSRAEVLNDMSSPRKRGSFQSARVICGPDNVIPAQAGIASGRFAFLPLSFCHPRASGDRCMKCVQEFPQFSTYLMSRAIFPHIFYSASYLLPRLQKNPNSLENVPPRSCETCGIGADCKGAER